MSDFDPGPRRSLSVAGLAATLLIVLISLVVMRKFQVRSMLESCAMSRQDGCVETVDRWRVAHFFAGR
jgi:hypothetical protein